MHVITLIKNIFQYKRLAFFTHIQTSAKMEIKGRREGRLNYALSPVSQVHKT